MEGGREKPLEASEKTRSGRADGTGSTREERLAMQLRENLKKRKALARAKRQRADDADV